MMRPARSTGMRRPARRCVREGTRTGGALRAVVPDTLPSPLAPRSPLPRLIPLLTLLWLSLQVVDSLAGARDAAKSPAALQRSTTPPRWGPKRQVEVAVEKSGGAAADVEASSGIVETISETVQMVTTSV